MHDLPPVTLRVSEIWESGSHCQWEKSGQLPQESTGGVLMELEGWEGGSLNLPTLSQE
jgi:hypothetical protein